MKTFLLHFWYNGREYLIFVTCGLVISCSIDLVQGRDTWQAVSNAVMNLQVPKNTGNVLTSSEPVHFSRRNLLHGTVRNVM
jgi:hypothetical protein